MASARSRQILMCVVQYNDEVRSGAVSITEIAPIAARLGLQGVEYREVYWKDKGRELPAVRDQLEQFGLMATYATFTPLFSKDPAQRAQLRQDLEDARSLGSPLMRVFRGERPDDDSEMILAARNVIERAGDYGMRLALENHIGHLGNRMADVKDTLELLDSPVMGCNVDISNYVLNDQNPLVAIRTLSPWVIYSHLKDVKQTDAGMAATYLGDGNLPYGEILTALDATGRAFPLCFEFGGGGDPEGSIKKSLAFLRSL